MRSVENALSIIKEVGYGRLAGYDGCVCSSVSIHNIDIEVSCRKGGGCMGGKIQEGFYGPVIHVSTGTIDIEAEDLAPLAAEVKREIDEVDSGRDKSIIRLCSWKDDSEGRCAYCGEPRAERWGYFCAKHIDPNNRGWDAATRTAQAGVTRMGRDSVAGSVAKP